MKNIVFLFLLVGAYCANAQQQYVTEKNIPYHADSIRQKDDYLSAQCTQDIYYPKNAKNFSCIVWFQGRTCFSLVVKRSGSCNKGNFESS